MNCKNKKRNELKNKRKVILLKCKDMRETLILTTTVKRQKNTVEIFQCNNEIVRNVSTKMCQTEKYPLFPAQLKNRIVPNCLRDNCSKLIQRKDHQCRRRRRESKHEPKHHRKIRSVSPIIISSDSELEDFKYDDISSESMSSYSAYDDDMQALMVSTRKRMRETDKEWKLTPRQVISINFENNFIASKSPSLNSLDTLILGAESEMLITTTSSSSVSLPLNEERIIKLESQETKNKEVKAKNETIEKNNNKSSCRSKHHDQGLDKNISTYIPIIKPENMVKSEPKESYNGLRSVREAAKHVQNGYYKKIKAEPTNNELNNLNCILKINPDTLIENKLKETSSIVTQERISISRDQKYEKISAVIAKLERNEFDTTPSKPNNINMKQELYSDI